jgi:integrase
VGAFVRRLNDPGLIIRRIDRDGAIGRGGISGEAARKRLLSLARAAAVDRFSPHDGRRTYCSLLLGSGADLAVVARLMGHGSIQVTAGYDRRGEIAEIEAVGLFRLPYGV